MEETTTLAIDQEVIEVPETTLEEFIEAVEEDNIETSEEAYSVLLQEAETEVEATTEETTTIYVEYGNSYKVNAFEYMLLSKVDILVVCSLFMVGLNMICFLQLRRK